MLNILTSTQYEKLLLDILTLETVKTKNDSKKTVWYKMDFGKLHFLDQ